MNKIILGHPTGNANVRAAAQGLAESDMLYEFYTSVGIFSGSTLDTLGRFRIFSELRKRTFSSVLKPYLRTNPFLELGRNLATKLNLVKLTQHEVGIFCIDNVYKNSDRHLSSRLKSAKEQGVKGIFAYEDGAFFSFKNAKKLGINCLYELPTGYWRTAQRLMEREANLRPEWAATIKGLNDSHNKLASKDEELKLADRIFVASSFAAKTLEEFPGSLAKTEIIPYGFPPVSTDREYRSISNKMPLKLLFVGRLTQFKGIAHLFEAVEKLKMYVELTIVGLKPTENCNILNRELKKHDWIPRLPHHEILNLMKMHDLLVFPSLFEGFGLVITEAMSQGTPVITTDRTAGYDLINHGENGWVIKAGATDLIIEVIENLLNHPKLIEDAGRLAIQTAKNRPWNVYSKELSSSILKFLNSEPLI